MLSYFMIKRVNEVKLRFAAIVSILVGIIMMLTPICANAALIDPSGRPVVIDLNKKMDAAKELVRKQTWTTNARTALTEFANLDQGNEEVMAYAHIAAASGRLNGWTSDVTLEYLDKVYSLQKPNGGWGLGYSYDAFQDGTINSADTVYTVTLADHIGKTFLEGYKAGVIPASEIQWIVDKLVSLPRVPVTVGLCVAYSDQIADAKSGLCVHNVNAGVGGFLASAKLLGFTNSGMTDLISGINTQESATYNSTTKFWAYYNGRPAESQDPDHNSYSAESMFMLNPPLSNSSATYMMQTSWANDPLSPIVHMRLTSLPDGSQRTAGDKYFVETANFIANPPAPAGNRLAQAAYYSSRNIQGK